VGDPQRSRRIEGCLLGTAVGDALGLPYEGLSAKIVQKRFSPHGYALVGDTGFVSDDTEQSALVAQALCRRKDGDAVVVAGFRRSLLGWFLRLPFGIGLATIRACLKLLVGLRDSGVRSAGNGAAMRSMIIGAVVDDDRDARVRIATAIARVTHTDERAVAAAVFVADVAAGDIDAVSHVAEPQLRAKLDQAADLADDVVTAPGALVDQAAAALGTSGFVLESVPFSYFCFLRFGASFEAVTRCIGGGGDADTNGAIVGGWVGAWDRDQIPGRLVERLARGPFGSAHLRALATSLSSGAPAPSWSPTVALLRNLMLYPVVLAHGFRRLLPF
jgi:ADP-ribosylglycohydrolase